MRLVSLVLFLAACPTTEPVACSTLAAASVTVNVVDGSGNDIEGAVVTFRVDGAASQTCESFTPGVYVCGWEQSGEIAVTVEADGLVTSTQTVTVGLTEDECHVEGQTLDFAMEPVECTDVEVYAVQVTLTGSGGETLDRPQVTWERDDTEMEPQPCDLDGDVWSCAPEETGDIAVFGTAGGHTTAFELVTVYEDEDGCHPITELVDLVVEWLPD